MTNKETLEEASIRLVPNRTLKTPFGSPYEITPTRERNTFKKGAKWQQERSYSEEEQLNLLNKYNEYLFTFIDKDVVGIGVEEEDVIKWFEQFKKK
jgi:hypothetical protein